MDFKPTFGEWLKDEYDGRLGWTQGELAARVGVAQNTISAWVNGKPAGLRNLRRLADALGVSRAEVIRRGGKTPTPSDYPPPDLPSVNNREEPQPRSVVELLKEALEVAEGLPIPVIGCVPGNAGQWARYAKQGLIVRPSDEQLGGRSPASVIAVRVLDYRLSRQTGLIAGDYALCDPFTGQDPTEGDVVVVRIGDDYCIGHWRRDGDQTRLDDDEGTVVRAIAADEEIQVVGVYFTGYRKPRDTDVGS